MVKKKLKKKHLQVSTEYTNGQADGGRTPHDDVASRGKNTVCRLSQDHGDALDELCAQLTRDLFAIAKFLLVNSISTLLRNDPHIQLSLSIHF